MKIDTNYDFELYSRVRNNWIDSEEGRTSWENGSWSIDFERMIWRCKGRVESDWMDPKEMHVADGVGIVLGKEHIVFDNEHDYTMFLLKWL